MDPDMQFLGKDSHTASAASAVEVSGGAGGGGNGGSAAVVAGMETGGNGTVGAEVGL